MPALRSQLLRFAVPLVKDYGFTREALAKSVLAHNEPSLKEHKEPLSEDALDALFGPGNDSRRTLIHAWLDEGLDRIREMGRQTREQQRQLDTTTTTTNLTLRQVLHARLAYNEPALPYIPEVVTLSPQFLNKTQTFAFRHLLSSSRLRPEFLL
jgi:ubiquinone biosynthesis protein COQ9